MKNSIDFSVSLLHFRGEFAFKSLVLLRFCSSALGLCWRLSEDYLRVLFRRMIGGQKTRGKCVPDAMHEFAGHKII